MKFIETLTTESYTSLQPSFCEMNLVLIPLNWSISSNLQISSQALAGSQSVGFAWGLSNPMPPVSRNRHSSSLISLSCFRMLTQSRKENNSCGKRQQLSPKPKLYTCSKVKVKASFGYLIYTPHDFQQTRHAIEK